MLSAVAHARTEDAPHIAAAALAACAALDSEHASLYVDLVLTHLDAVAREPVEKLMNLQGYRAGREEGLQEGQKEGRREGLMHLLTMQLEARFGPLPEHGVQALATARPSSLLAWGRRVLAAESLDDVFTTRTRRGTQSRGKAAQGTRPRGKPARSKPARSKAARSARRSRP